MEQSTAPKYEVTRLPAQAAPVELTPEKVAAALRAFFRIMEAWGVKNEEARVLLGRPGRSTFYAWKRGDSGVVPHDTVCRISYVLGIYQALQILFKAPEQADGWVRRPNAFFAGSSALSRMLGGDVTDLAAVRNYLDAVRGQGA
jgi:hypothetical protein